MTESVAIVDDHEVVTLAMAALIGAHPALEFAGSARTVGELIGAVRRPTLVVLDLSLRDGTSPAGNVRALRRWGAEVIAFTSGENPYLVREVSRTAALGIVRKSAPAAVIVEAIARAAAGEPVATTEWAAALDSDPALRTAPLTAREREVLGLYASGLGAKAVAYRLGITENTVDDHIRRIRTVYRQLGRPAHSKVDLYRRGVEDGYLPPPAVG
jgi:DNA-binding NarL/FixJ family response regulator